MFARRSLLIALIYFGAGWLGLRVPYVGTHITLIWLPTGIALAALYRWGWGVLPGVYLGALAVNLSIGSVWTLAAGIAIGNTCGPWLAALLLKRLHFKSRFVHQRDVGVLLLAAVVGMAITATSGVLNLHVAGLMPWSGMSNAWLAWWMGDTIGVLLATPLLLSWRPDVFASLRRAPWELTLWLLLACLLESVDFAPVAERMGLPLSTAFLTLPMLAWAALRFGIAGASLAALGFSCMAAWSTVTGHGNFAQPNYHFSLFLLWSYMATLTLSGLLIVAVQAERHQVERSLHAHDEKLRGLFALSPLGIALVDMSGNYIEFNDAFRRICGYTEPELRALDYWALTPKHYEDDEHRQLEILEATGRYGPYEKEYRRKDGRLVPIRLNGMLLNGEDGERYIWSIVEDISDRKAAEDEIRQLAFYDPLTQLPNRRLLLDRLNQALANCARTAAYGALMFIDLDNFKALNDTEGHQTGDHLLQQVALRLNQCTRKGDTVSRLGGDEFVLILENLGEQTEEAAVHAEHVGVKVLGALNQPYLLDGRAYHGTPSIGVVLFDGQRETMDELLKQADLAMYQAKAAGRNTVRFFDPAMQAAAAERVAMEMDLRVALVERQFVLHYQVQVNAAGTATGAEALLRWQHPQRGLVPPNAFIPLAEETGLIKAIGHHVMHMACVELARWASQPALAELTLAVNVSAQQLHQADFVNQVLNLLNGTGANPRRLKLELTESILMEDVESTIAKINTLSQVGVGFALDDFGTGYSSLYYLKRLPIEKLKIDRSFVMDILTDTYDAELAKTIIALAHTLGLEVIAEGVETAAQRDFLAQHGCRAYQGYFYGRPLPMEAFERSLAQLGCAVKAA